MNKYIKYFILSLSAFSLMTSCETTSDVDLPRNVKPVVNIESANVELEEGGTAIISIVTEKASTKQLVFKLVKTGGTAEDTVQYSFGDNYSAGDYGVIGGKIVIPAFETTGSVVISGVLDYFVGGNTSVDFELESMESMNGVVGESKTVSVSIANIGAENLIVKLDWDQDFASDLDMFMFRPDGTGHSVQWTGDIPEIAEMISPDDPDGTYTLGIDPYTVASGAVSVPMTWSFSEPNGEASSMEQLFDYENRATTYSTLDYSGTTAYIVADVVKLGNDFTITLR